MSDLFYVNQRTGDFGEQADLTIVDINDLLRILSVHDTSLTREDLVQNIAGMTGMQRIKFTEKFGKPVKRVVAQKHLAA